MDPNIEHIARLIYRSLGEGLDDRDQTTLDAWLTASVEHQAFYDQLAAADDWRIPVYEAAQLEAIRADVFQEVRRKAGLDENDDSTARKGATHVRSIRRWWWAAACVLLLAGGATLFYVLRPDSHQQGPVVEVTPGKNDALPGKNGAVLTLADGRKVILDSLGNGIVAEQNGAQAILQNGRLVYDAGKNLSNTITYNTMSTPKGRQFQLRLPDGTLVWLNAASSITYPTMFAGNERPVRITGEVYFEVAKDVQKPFYVSIDESTRVEVLGTHFNINAYADEGQVRTTLLEGSVRVVNGEVVDGKEKVGAKVMLQPGQQAVIRDGREGDNAGGTGSIQKLSGVNITSVMAWKNGVFNFNGLSLAELMRQLARWYDVEIVYSAGVPPAVTLGGEVGRDLNLLQVLEGLQEMGVRCRLEGRRLIVSP